MGTISGQWMRRGSAEEWRSAALTLSGILLACDYASDYDVVGKPVVVNQAIAFQDR